MALGKESGCDLSYMKGDTAVLPKELVENSMIIKEVPAEEGRVYGGLRVKE